MARRGAVFLVGGLLLAGCRGGAQAVSYVTAPVERGSVVGRVTATGTLSATVTVQVGAQVSGRITAINADFNSRVKKGDVLLLLDPQLFQAALAQTGAAEKVAEGNLAKAKAQVADSARKLKRQQELAAQKLVAQADLDTAQADFEMSSASVMSAEGALAQARAARQQAQVNLTYATVLSPIDGTVISRAVDVGQTVAASLSAPTLFTIAEDLARMQVDTSIAEADVGKLKEGVDASFTVDAFPNQRFKGTVRQIRFAPQVVSNVVTYDAVIDVANPQLLLRPGMTANVTFIYARADEVLRVPNAALRFRPDGAAPGAPGGRPGGEQRRGAGGRGDGGFNPDKKTVHLLRDGAPVAVPVEVGLSDGSFSEVKAGDLKEGDLVVVDKQGGEAKPPSGQPPSGMGGMRRVF